MINEDRSKRSANPVYPKGKGFTLSLGGYNGALVLAVYLMGFVEGRHVEVLSYQSPIMTKGTFFESYRLHYGPN